MGVQGLWELLSPVGRRVSVQTLSGKKLAIDASIWIVQFMKAMRDEKGEMVRNAHLIGFFRRICKLMFLRAKPVFVFDGGTPALKRRTVIARRRMRENAKAKVRKTAEKLLLNHLKAMRLKELADDLENQRKKNDAKGKKVINDETEMASNNVDETKIVRASLNQEELDAMLAASLAAEEDRNINGNASTSGAGVAVDEDEEDEDEDEEMVLPAMSGKVDPAVLASLPPSMQLDLLVQMRERLMAENRQKYQKVKKAPAKFSELQIQSYLKTVAFRREIDQVQKVAAGKDMGGVQTSRIASEANREFIFSSSFSGDKEALASAGVDGHSKKSSFNKSSEISSTLLDSVSSTSNSNNETESVSDNTKKALVEEIETYKDERGRFRVSRVRAMGIRMTRDLQRNLDLIKEIEQDTMQTDEIPDIGSNLQKNVEPKDLNDESTSKNEKFMEISFEDNGGEKSLDGDDDIFARLVAGETNIITSSNSGSSKGDLSFHAVDVDDESEVEWEDDNLNNLKCASPSPTETGKSAFKGGEKFMEGDDDIFVRLVAGETNKKSSHNGSSKDDLSSSHAGDADDEIEVEWEEDDIYDPKCAFLSSSESTKIASKGVLEEEADFQEALRRSLKELSGNKFSEVPLEDKNLKEAIEMAHEGTGAGSLHEENENGGVFENLIDVDEYPNEVLNEVGRIDADAIANKTISDDIFVELPTSMAGFCDMPGELEKQHSKIYPSSDFVPLIKEKSEGENLLGEPQISDIVLGETSNTISVAEPKVVEAVKNDMSSGTTKQREIQVDDITDNDVTVQEFPEQKAFDNISVQRGDDIEEFPFEDDLTNSVQFTKADLEEEMQNLSQECIELGDQQRKLNRNMESVSSEMFAECQELLQMFGLPYIIAPMEAEAQCAYMELAGLVDGVVTDDSDAFLFGAKSVYKNIFDDRKYVETYFMKDIENELGLSRDKLIRMALLLGSDYTEGVSGIGIVNAIEVVNAFPEDNGFRKFREWIESPDPNILGKVGTQTVSKSKLRGSEVSDMDNIDESKRLFMNKHRNVSKNWHMPSTFPNEAVISAYASPEVDKSTEPFSWGKPDHFVLRKLCWEKFGWNVQKADELLIPVLKEYNKRETQLRLEAFYTFNEKFAKIRSKRIQKAVKGIRGNISSEIMDGDDQEISKRRKKIKMSPAKCPTKNSLSGKGENENNLSEILSNKRKHGEIVTSKEKAKEIGKRSKGGKNVNRLSGKGRRGETRGGRMKTPELDSDESSDDGNNSDFEKEMLVESEEKTRGVRKSTRSRKAVKYTLDDLESDEPGKEDQQEMSSGNPVPVEVQSSKDDSVVGNDAAAAGEKNQAKVGDTSLVKCSSENYIQMGGGFCIEEADPEFEISNLSSAPKDKLLFEKELPKEDLMVGGGFCLEEDGADDRYVHEGEHKLDPSAPTSEVESSTFPVSPYQGNKGGDSSTVPEKSLSAMPTLKRKRRKS